MSQKPIIVKRQQSLTTKSGNYWEKLKNVEVKKISQYKTKETNLKMRHYWNDVIREMERLAMQQAEQTKIKINDLSTSLPPKLYKRISKILPLNPIKDDVFEDEFEDQSKTVKQSIPGDFTEPQMEIWTHETFNESTCTLINQEEELFKHLNLQIEKPVEKKKSKIYQKNWQSEFLCQKQKERIKWNSKLYKLNEDIWEKPLYEQAEDLMDNSAEHFLEWLNNISKISETNMTKDLLKKLFSLEVDPTLARGIENDPKILGAVPERIAKSFNMPEKSIRLKMEEKRKSIHKNIPKKIITHAFGRTLPPNMRQWIPPDSYNVIKPDIPKDLRQCKVIFQGITHLRATKRFIDYCLENPETEKPEYLQKQGCFNDRDESKTSKIIEPPLTELLQLTS